MAKTPYTSPHARYLMPAEWERHEATWLGWPHNRSDWPSKFAAIPWAYVEMVRKISAGERVRVLVQSTALRNRASRMLNRAGVNLKQIDWLVVRTNRGWTRDFGPIFVRTESNPPPPPPRRGGREEVSPPGRGIRGESDRHQLAIANFQFNAWAKYPNWKLDNTVPAFAARKFKRPIYDVIWKNRPVVLEGGAIDVNGRGTLITTEECLLDPKVQVRNPGLTRKDMEQVFRDYLGATNVIWLGKGIAGDDTHGHVDDLCRFVNKNTLVIVREKNRRDANYRPLEENIERLQSARLENGKRPRVVELPMPAPLYFEGRRLPASYANFYITNAAVIVPTFNDPNDRKALGTLSELFPDRPVVGIHAVDLVWGLGTLHCLTQQEPAAH